jgi:predicted TIM-barrel fold metal-dependent hydrolase
MIIDAHAHAWPYLGGASGYASAKDHLKYLQKSAANAGPHLRMVGPRPLEDEDVDFRVGKYGRTEWTKNGQECYLQMQAPVIKDMEWPPESMLAHMDWIGVDKGVLFQNHIYGKLNEYLSECVRKWPNRFAATAQVDEKLAYTEPILKEVKHCLTQLKLKGLYFQPQLTSGVDDPKYDPLWRLLVDLKSPVVWEIGVFKTLKEYLTAVGRLEAVHRRFPDLVGVFTHMTQHIKASSDPEALDPQRIASFLRLPNLYLELGYFLPYDTMGEEYPYPMGLRFVKSIAGVIGAGKMTWGADMPATMRSCTYRQSVDVIRRHCDFFSEEERALILGKNAEKVFFR